ncbi:MAG: hypothetical protein ACOX6J_06825, partial [Oscillospiraceae bacterium]
MVEKLRKKFILTAMVSILIVIVCIVAAISLVSRYQMLTRADSTLEYIAMNGGDLTPNKGDASGTGSAPPDDSGQGTVPEDKPDDGEGPNGAKDNFSGFIIDQETPFKTRYFYVVFASDGTVESTYLEMIASVTQ